MSQVSKYPIRNSVFDRIFEIFIKTLINVRNDDEAQALASDFFTPTERIMLSKRLAIALLLEKEYDYRSIKELLKVSTGTITSVNNARRFGKNGYKNIVSKIVKEEAINDFFDKALIALVSAPASGTKGAGPWKYLRDELKKKKAKNTKPF